jgi:hypothetical protein
MPNDYSYPHKIRKEDPAKYAGTDPGKILKSDIQRIDKNVYTPEQMIQNNPQLGGLEKVKTA